MGFGKGGDDRTPQKPGEAVGQNGKHPLRGLGSLPDLLAELGAPESGLSTLEAARRLRSGGDVRRHRPRIGPFLSEVIRGLANPLLLILIFAAAISAAAGDDLNAGIIGTMVVMSLGLNLWQTYRSGQAVRKLQSSLALTATVKRDGAWRDVVRTEVVEGDVIRLSAGDLVPADSRLMETHDLHVQQSALTGESFPVEKEALPGAAASAGPESPGHVFLGTSIVSGTAVAVAYAAGGHTAFGSIVKRLSSPPETTEFEHGLRRFGMLIFRTILFLVLFILAVNIALGREPMQSLLFSIALAVGLTPEFLPMITSVTLAKGALRMSREKVIVKHLSSIQNLGSIDILCSDKTGTLTTGKVSLSSSLGPEGGESPRALLLARINSRFEAGIRSPFDQAILEGSTSEAEGFQKTDEIPFDFNRRRLSVVVAKGDDVLMVTKGAPESVLDCCSDYEVDGRIASFTEAARGRCREVHNGLSDQGFRVLAVAYKRPGRRSGLAAGDEKELILAGLLAFSDHMLEGVDGIIEGLRKDGVRVKILTGDDERVTRHLCARVGIEADRVVLGSDLEKLDEAALAKIAEERDVFARVSPAQKYRIMKSLRSHGHVVGFLGDGINDAPSLHGADVGISVAGAVDVAREASDIILLERRLDVLHAGIMAGRSASGNVLKYLLMGTSSNFGNMFSMACGAAFLPFLPMLPMQILLNNFLYDLAQVTIPTDRIDPEFIRRPQRWNIDLIRKFMLVVGPISSLFDFLTFLVLLRLFHFGEALFHTGWFVESLATQALVLFVIRTAGRPWKNRPSLPLVLTTLSVVAAGAVIPFLPFAQALGFQPLPGTFFLFLVPAVAGYLVLVEAIKRRIMRNLLVPEGRGRGER